MTLRYSKTKPPIDRIAFELSPEMRALVEASAAERGQSMTMWVRRACEAELRRSELPTLTKVG